jgi:hypothetical protein
MRVFAAEALLLPTGVVTAAFLTRQLGPADYGRFTLAATLGSWVAWFVGTLYGRAMVKLISESDESPAERSPVVAALMRAYLASGIGGAAALFQPPGVSRDSSVSPRSIRIYGFSHSKWHASRSPWRTKHLVGLGRFRERATCATARWIAYGADGRCAGRF